MIYHTRLNAGRQSRALYATLLTCLLLLPSVLQAQTVSGELKQWHTVTLTIDGPNTNENANPNPFTNYRMNVTFTHPGTGTSFVVPGYYAADGDAAESSATTGNKWRAHIAPPETGTWNYSVSFRSGTNIALSTSPTAGSPVSPYNGISGSFNIGASDKTGRDFRAHGRLAYVGKHHLQFQGSGRYFIKFGADSPENFVSYNDVDNTPVNGRTGIRHTWAPHTQDWNTGDPQWQGTKGREAIGALNYLASQGAHTISTLLYTIDGGDDGRIFPWTATNNKNRFDVSKLAQWGILFAHANNIGLNLSFKLSEEENWEDLSQNDVRLYYREMVARFGHHLAVTWIISEEYGGFSIVQAEVDELQFRANTMAALDPWDNNLVTHTAPGTVNQNAIYQPSVNNTSFTGASLQVPNADTTAENVFNRTLFIRNLSISAGNPWVVANDEQGPAGEGVQEQSAGDRKYTIWGNLMAGGAGTEFYVNWSQNNLDASLEDWRTLSTMWAWARYCINDFVIANNIPFWDMENRDDLLSNGGGNHCLAVVGNTYVIYLDDGGTTSLNLNGQSGTFDVRWFDPRNGGNLQNGSVTSITGGGSRSIGNPPGASGSDWAVLVTNQSGPTQDTISCSQLPTTVASQTSYTVTIPYTATQSRDIVVEFWDSGWLSQGKTTVNNSSGNASVTINLPTAPTPGTNYLFKVSIRPVGGNWTTALDFCQEPFTVSGGSTGADLDRAITATQFDAESNPTDDNLIRVLTGKVGFIKAGTWIRFDSFDFGTGAASVDVSASSGSVGGRIEFRLGSTTGTLVGSVDVTNTTGWNTFQTFSTNVSASGIHDLFLVFVSPTNSTQFLLDVQSFTFNSGTPPANNADLGVLIQAELFDAQNGIQVVGGTKVGFVEAGDWIRFDAVEIVGASSFTANLSSNTTGGTVEIRTGSPTGTILGSVSTGNTGGWNTFLPASTNSLGSVSTVTDLYLVFTGGSGFLLDVDSFQFD
ncbi:MAG: carbohydrate-binding protein [Verrucomicrobiota bacterium]